MVVCGAECRFLECFVSILNIAIAKLNCSIPPDRTGHILTLSGKGLFHSAAVKIPERKHRRVSLEPVDPRRNCLCCARVTLPHGGIYTSTSASRPISGELIGVESQCASSSMSDVQQESTTMAVILGACSERLQRRRGLLEVYCPLLVTLIITEVNQ